jgi:hypothetical protein
MSKVSTFLLVHPNGNENNVQILEVLDGVSKRDDYILAEDTVYPDREKASMRIINHYYRRKHA